MLEIQKPQIAIQEIELDNFYGKFVIEPLGRGYGTTLGNSLRRIMLSSLPGAAITSIKIDGVPHEFSSIKGVVEDVTQIILNLKNVIVQVDHQSDDNDKIIEINATTAGAVTAGDIDLRGDTDITIINPDLHIATVAEGGSLNIEMVVRKGTGYVSAEENKEDMNNLTSIAIDSIYTPVKKVTYHVEPANVGQNSNYDKLTMEVHTRGSIEPHVAIALAAKLMTEHLNEFINLSERAVEVEFLTDKEEESKGEVYDKAIEFLDLSVRSYNSLKRAEINTVYDLIQLTTDELSKIRNLGKKSFKEIQDKVTELGFSLKEE